MNLLVLVATLAWPLIFGCDATAVPTSSHPDSPVESSNEQVVPVVEQQLMRRMYGLGGLPMRRGLVVFGERVLVVAHPSDDRTPQHIVVANADGQLDYLLQDGTFLPVPNHHSQVHRAAVLRGEGIEADYGDGVLVLLNSDSLSEWTDSGFLDWGSGRKPSGSPPSWSTSVPLVVRESHQRTVAVLDRSDEGAQPLIVSHVSRLFKDSAGREPVHFPAAKISTDRGRSWTWGPERPEFSPPAGAYAAAWPNAPGGGAILYFINTLPADDYTPPLAVFRPSSGAIGVTLEVPHASRQELWRGHDFISLGRSHVPFPIRHWVTRWGLILETISQGLFWMDHPESLPIRIDSPHQRLDAVDRVLYFTRKGDIMRVLASGGIERLDDPRSSQWTEVGEIERPDEARWIQAAASDSGALWLLGLTDSPYDVSIGTWPPGTAL